MSDWIRYLPLADASLNALATVFLVLGWRAIRQGNKERHKKLMLTALAASAAFLVCYLIYHAHVGSVRFTADGWPRKVYFFILVTHIPLAGIMVVPILMVVRYALKGRLDAHRRLARWTLPIWLYVSVTGVLIYLFLNVWFPPAGGS